MWTWQIKLKKVLPGDPRLACAFEVKNKKNSPLWCLTFLLNGTALFCFLPERGWGAFLFLVSSLEGIEGQRTRGYQKLMRLISNRKSLAYPRAWVRHWHKMDEDVTFSLFMYDGGVLIEAMG